jgi:hypothetical protein
VLLGEVRALGFPIFLACPVCNYGAEVGIEALAAFSDELDILGIGHAVRCTNAGVAAGRAPIPRLEPAELTVAKYVKPERERVLPSVASASARRRR